MSWTTMLATSKAPRLASMALLLCVPLAAGCQELDEKAASSAGQDAGPALKTPPIELPDGGATSDPCVSVNLQAMQILTTDCASCHGGGNAGASQGQPPFGYVLDVAMLLTARSASVPDPIDTGLGMRFLRPGSPEDSRLYVRMVHGEMPPAAPLGADPIPTPSVSDESVLYTWISSCLQ